MKTDSFFEKFFRLISSTLIVLLMFGIGGNARAVISQVPLFVSTVEVEPNILFILDDSGSMQWEYMPDQTIFYTVYLYPMPASVYNGTNYPNQVPNHDDNNLHNFFSRSSANNTVFYNPDITYQPWSNADGTVMPDADPNCALYNPALPARGCLNLMAEQTERATWFWNTADQNQRAVTVAEQDHTYWPISYYTYNGGNRLLRPSYTRVLITSATPAAATFTSPDGKNVRTRDEEVQNFANWFQYYRSRILAARAGIGRAFAGQSELMRVGFGAINKGLSTVDEQADTLAIISGVRLFSGANRVNFFRDLYGHTLDTSGTPLRRALKAAGQYFERTDNRGPWGHTPGSDVNEDHLTCRQSYTILMTDGFWNGPAPDGIGNADNTDGPDITNPAGDTYQYSPSDPYRDNWSDTLADVAMHYWKRDLRPEPNMKNRVPTSSQNEAFWQHMVTFGVGFGVQGTIDPDDAWAAVNPPVTAIPWPNPAASDPAKLDDLLHAGVNSRGGFFTASDPDTFANELASVLENIVARIDSSAAALATNSTKLETGTATYQAKFNSGDWSGQLTAYPVDSDGTLGPENWNTDDTIPPDPTWWDTTRKVFTMIGDAKVEFKWSALSAGQQATLENDGITVDILNWIRGDQSKEKPNGTLRQRAKLLGDIVNSDLFYVDGPPMVYVGANDGMLHAFDAATGAEKFAYIPQAVLPNLSSLANPNYSHRYFVDGSPIVTKLHDGRLILVGTTGAGGRSVFALDVTDPANFDASKVLWEFTDATDQDLGYTIGQPSIGRLPDGQGGAWVAVFGNGYHSDNGRAFLFVRNLTDANAPIIKIPTNNDPDNGLAKPALLLDGDRRIAAAYAGDLQGNLWKFDLTNNAVAFGGAPLFVARDAANNTQPITSSPEIGRHPNGGHLVLFGTGKYFEVGDHAAPATPQQSFYGIWDNETGAVAGRNELLEQEVLSPVGLTAAGNNWRVVSPHLICWVGQGACVDASGNSIPDAHRGWYLDLPTAGERVTDRPMLSGGRVVFTTRIPFTSNDPCIPSVGTSWFMAVDMLTGGRTEATVFDVNRDGRFDEFDRIKYGQEWVTVSGFQTIAAGMSRATLLRSAGSIDILQSGTSELTTTASATAASDRLETQAAAAAIAAARVPAAQAAATQAAADAAPGDAAAQAAAQAAAAAAVQAIIAAAQDLIAAAQAIEAAGGIISADGKVLVSVSDAQKVINKVQDIIAALRAGIGNPSDHLQDLDLRTAELKGSGWQGAALVGGGPRSTWRQLR